MSNKKIPQGVKASRTKLFSKYYGFFYIVRCDGIYKIGYTSDIKKRMFHYRSSNPRKVELIFVEEVHEPFKIEQCLIKYFNDKKVTGEWFSLNEKNVAKIISFILKWKILTK